MASGLGASSVFNATDSYTCGRVRSSLSIHDRKSWRVATAALSSASSMMRPACVSTRSMRPGCSRPFWMTLSGSTWMAPTSDAQMMRSSSMT